VKPKTGGSKVSFVNMWSGKVLNLFKIVFIITEKEIFGRVFIKMEKRKQKAPLGRFLFSFFFLCFFSSFFPLDAQS
jgi:hypothetical protein